MKLDINDYSYHLPNERIAQYPLPQRDQSKLLVYDKGTIRHEIFSNLVNFLPPGATLFFNETKVIPARLFFQKETGAVIEVFLLNPVKPSANLWEAMQATATCTWKCVIGNLKRWPAGALLSKNIHSTTLSAALQDREQGIVTFSWTGSSTFAAILQQTGNTPLPPYLKRDAEDADKERYQTVYSNKEGAVAAPTAGLHFTPEVFKTLQQNKISTEFLTLHVSAGTFQPIKVRDAMQHTMHQEQVVISRKNIEKLLHSNSIVAVGTTSLRTLESLYWYGVKLIENPEATFIIEQHYPYTHNEFPAVSAALEAILKHMDRDQKETITGETSIYIVPGYTFRLCSALITNFHQPASTLILLVAAFIGKDWKSVYNAALGNDYRFLSFGDSSLLIPDRG